MSNPNLYGLVVEGAVQDGPRALPTSWRTDEAEVLAFDRLDDATPYGWWPWIEESAPAFDPAKQRLEPAIRLDTKAKRIIRGYSVVNLSAEQIAAADPVPDRCTNSDWRVGLILWGRFDEVEAKVIAARDSKTVEGAIVWQRWEYANEVFRTELLALRTTFGFSVEEVDESLRRGAAVPEQARMQAEASLAA